MSRDEATFPVTGVAVFHAQVTFRHWHFVAGYDYGTATATVFGVDHLAHFFRWYADDETNHVEEYPPAVRLFEDLEDVLEVYQNHQPVKLPGLPGEYLMVIAYQGS